jgi:hypothetical protein
MLGTHYGILVADVPDSVSAAALSIAVTSTGAFKTVQTHELLTRQQVSQTPQLAKGCAGLPATRPARIAIFLAPATGRGLDGRQTPRGPGRGGCATHARSPRTSRGAGRAAGGHTSEFPLTGMCGRLSSELEHAHGLAARDRMFVLARGGGHLARLPEHT